MFTFSKEYSKLLGVWLFFVRGLGEAQAEILDCAMQNDIFILFFILYHELRRLASSGDYATSDLNCTGSLPQMIIIIIIVIMKILSSPKTSPYQVSIGYILKLNIFDSHG